jgi:hypothetical protein
MPKPPTKLLTGQGSDADRCYQDGRSAGTEGSRTRRWREMDSNFRFAPAATPLSDRRVKPQATASRLPLLRDPPSGRP